MSVKIHFTVECDGPDYCWENEYIGDSFDPMELLGPSPEVLRRNLDIREYAYDGYLDGWLEVDNKDYCPKHHPKGAL